jgi:hypothetical protein
MARHRAAALGRAALAAALAVAAIAAMPAASAATQDPGSYPPGILDVSHSPVLDEQDFDVTVLLDDGLETQAERVTVTVCKFSKVDSAAPDVCYMNLGAARLDEAWRASTGAVDHPDWHDGWVLGYKVTVKTAAGETHAPDRLAASGEPDYYRFVVGAPDEPEPQGSAVVEDSAPEAGAPAAGPGRESPSPPLLALLGLGLALGGRVARRR